MRRRASIFLCVALFGCGADPVPSATSTTTTYGAEASTSVGADVGTSDTDDTDDTGETTGSGPLPDIMPFDECEPFTLACEPGFKCVPFASAGEAYDDNKCVPVAGEAHEEEPCRSTGPQGAVDDCDGDTVCFNLIAEAAHFRGECMSRCGGSADDPICPPWAACVDPPVVAMCAQRCDPLLQDCPDLGCYWVEWDFVCLVAGEAPINAGCELETDCTPGLACISSEYLPSCGSDQCCTPYCDLDDPDCGAVPGTECAAFYEEGVGWDIGPGLCVVPGTWP